MESLNMNTIGLVCNVTSKPRLKEGITPWMHRALAINRELALHKHHLFCYNPDEIEPHSKTVRGYLLNGSEFHETTLPIPLLNYQTSYYMGLFEDTYIESLPFQAWAFKQGYEFYPYNSINRLLFDKLAIAQTLTEFNSAIQPKTDAFAWNRTQLEEYTSQFDCVFIKPRFGGWGDDIFVIKKDNNDFKINYYREGEVHTKSSTNLHEILSYIDKKGQVKQYIIQQGVDVIRLDGYVFDVRTVVMKNSNDWFFVSQVRQGAKSKEVSNIAQGGQDYVTSRYLAKVFSPEKAQLVYHEIEKLSKDIANFLVKKHHAQLDQFAVDVLIDKSGKLYIAELNNDPILLGSPKNFSNFFNMTEAEKELYVTTTLKHGEYLAKSMLQAKAKLQHKLKAQNALQICYPA
jgi:glutathione synthase/RimK-type ligase-like ATP-grasp enzyme